MGDVDSWLNPDESVLTHPYTTWRTYPVDLEARISVNDVAFNHAYKILKHVSSSFACQRSCQSSVACDSWAYDHREPVQGLCYLLRKRRLGTLDADSYILRAQKLGTGSTSRRRTLFANGTGYVYTPRTPADASKLGFAAAPYSHTLKRPMSRVFNKTEGLAHYLWSIGLAVARSLDICLREH